jgi:hypothetical protein
VTPDRPTGFEIEAVLTMLPIFPPQDNIPSHDPLTALLRNEAQGESGPAWNTLLFFVLATAALKQQNLKAGIYQGAFDELAQLLGNDHPDVQVITKNLNAAGFLIPGYAPDTFGIGFDSSTVALPPENEDYYRRDLQQENPFSFKQFCGFEVNAPVYPNPVAMAEDFARMTRALQPLGLLTPGSCGIHQHIDIKDFTYRNLADLMRIQAFCDPAIRQTVFPPHRRDSRFCRPLDAHLTPLGDIPPLVRLSNRLQTLCTEYDAYAARGIDRITLLKSMAFEIQANIFPSGKINETFYDITNSILRGTLEEEIEEHVLNLRRQRYFDPSPESPYTKLTLEKRWMPATDNPEFARAWFILNYASVARVAACASSDIIYDNTTESYHLCIVDTAGGMDIYGQSFEEVMRYFAIPEDAVSHNLLRTAAGAGQWGNAPEATDENNGLWPQATVPLASLSSQDAGFERSRLEIYAIAEHALLGTSTMAAEATTPILQTLAQQLSRL